MKTSIKMTYNLKTMLCAWIYFTSIYTLLAEEAELKKNINKTFKVSDAAELRINNKFGFVQIQEGKAGVISVNIEMVAEAKTEERAQKILDRIDVKYTETTSLIEFITEIGNQNTGNYEKFKINYTVEMPAENLLTVKNSFGDVFVEKNTKRVDLSVSYGSLKAGLIQFGDPIKVSYGNADIDEWSEGEFVLKYSKGEINRAENLRIDHQFSELEINQAGDLKVKGRYGKFTVGRVQNLESDEEFSSFEIDELSGSLLLEAKYVSDGEIGHILPSFTTIDIDAQFSSFELYIDREVEAVLEAKTSFGEFRTSGLEVDYNYRVKENNKSEYRGKINSGKSDKRLRFYNSYGDIRLEAY